MRWDRLLPLALLVAVFAAYLNSLWADFVFDDDRILRDPTMRQVWPPVNLLDGWNRPLTKASLVLSYVLGGHDAEGVPDPAPYHLFNMAVHVAATLALFGVARRALTGPALRDRLSGRAATALGFAVALLWGVHPLNTQAVTYTIQRSESMMGLFYLFALYALAQAAADEPDAAPPGRAWRVAWGVVAAVAAFLAMAAKEVAITLPVIALLFDRTFLAGSFGAALRRRWPLYAGLLLSWALLFRFVASHLAPTDAAAPALTAGPYMPFMTPRLYLVSQAQVIQHYLRLSLWPHPLVLDYLWPPPLAIGDAAPAMLLVASLVAGTLWALWRKPWLGFLGAWFFVILAPTSSLVPVADLAMEHRMYLPLVAVVALAVVAAAAPLRRLARRDGNWRAAAVGVALLAVVGAALAVATARRNRDYRSDVAMWEDVAAKRPFSFRAHSNLAAAYFDAAIAADERPDRRYLLSLARASFERSLRLAPDDWLGHASLGEVLVELDRPREALAHFRRAVELAPEEARTHYKLGVVLLNTGDAQAAAAALERAVALSPHEPQPRANLGMALHRLGRTAEAIEHLEAAIQLEERAGRYDDFPASREALAKAHGNLGLVLQEVGRVDDALEHHRRAVVLTQYAPAFANNYALALAQVGRYGEAWGAFEWALRSNPRDVTAHAGMAAIELEQGRVDDAVRRLLQASRDAGPAAAELTRLAAWVMATDPRLAQRDDALMVRLAEAVYAAAGGGHADALDTLAAAYARAGRFADAEAAAARAVAAARAAGNEAAASEIERRLELYRQRRPFEAVARPFSEARRQPAAVEAAQP